MLGAPAQVSWLLLAAFGTHTPPRGLSLPAPLLVCKMELMGCDDKNNRASSSEQGQGSPAWVRKPCLCLLIRLHSALGGLPPFNLV